ncbi:hypothetical protein [Stutzerimonas nitrititolerans]|uniref:hypothetical protein n=1 Tax=Stutzerimonas nitrititolerans TaxID=2482751 RepID=UPI0028A8460A|nr:hypothetical protein [Stutzerimonas nitrititolerans]
MSELFETKGINLKSKPDGASETDGIDSAIEYIFKRSGSLLKFGPLAVGFLIFLIYFCQNNFFPSFDIFSLTSLLLAAFVIGLAAYLVLVFGIAAPGFFWFDTFVKDSRVNEELEYSGTWRSSRRNNENLRILGRVYFFLPLLFCNLFFLWVATTRYVDDDLKAVVSFIVLVFVCLAAAAELRKIYELGFGSIAKYVMTTFFSIFLSSVVNIVVVLIILKAHAETADESVQILIAVGGTVGLACVFFVSAIAGLTNYKYTIFFSALFAILLSLIAGAWAVLPENIIRILGIGNYPASEVVLNEGACKDMASVLKELVSDDCVINDAKIIWSLGETYRIEMSGDVSQKVISLPSSSVGAILVLPTE